VITGENLLAKLFYRTFFHFIFALMMMMTIILLFQELSR
jgi:hypothetical protein